VAERRAADTAARPLQEKITEDRMEETLYYITDYSDEIVPCDCRLQSWADWLSRPDENWDRPAPAVDGETFRASSLTILGDVQVEWIDGAWTAVDPIPAGTDAFFRRHARGAKGWDPDFAGQTLLDATDCIEPDEGPLWFACTRDNPDVILTYRAAGPSLDVDSIG